MAHDFLISKIPIQTSLFDKSVQNYQIVCNGDTLVILCCFLRTIVGNCKTRPLTNEEQDILCDLYNAISLYKLKHKIV